MICSRCDKPLPSATIDPDFCDDCHRHIERMTDNQMDMVRGVHLLSGHRTTSRDKLLAFLEIFHPEMSEERKCAMLADIDNEVEGVR